MREMCVCEVVSVTGMSVVKQSDTEVTATAMMMKICLDEKDDEEEDFRIPRWLTLAG